MKKIFTALLVTVFAAGLFGYSNYAEAAKDGHAKRAKRQFKEAKIAFTEALKLAKNDRQKSDAAFMQAIVTVEGGDRDGGVVLLKKVADGSTVTGLRISAQFHVGYYTASAGKYEQAIKDMQKVAVIAKEKNYHNIYVDRAKLCSGQYYLKLKKADDAIAVASSILDSKYKDLAVQAYSVICDANLQKKNMKEAQKAAAAGLKVKGVSGSGFFVARRTAWTVNLRTGDVAAALKAAKEIADNTKLVTYHRAHGAYYAALASKRLKNQQEEKKYWEQVAQSGIASLVKIAKQNLAAMK